MRLGTILKLKNINQKELAQQTNLSEPLLSKFKNYVCLPIPSDMKKICDVLKCEVFDIYDQNEIQYIKNKRKTSEELNCYKLCVRIHKSYRWLFKKELLVSLGFNSLKQMIQKLVINELQKLIIQRYHMEKLTKEKAELDATTSNPTNTVS